MIHNIAWKDRTQTVSCYLPEDSLPEKAAVTELYQMTELEETLKKLAAVPGIFQGGMILTAECGFIQRICRRSRL